MIIRVRRDPKGFLDEIQTPVILDEIQNVPELFNYIRTRVDKIPGKKGQWLLTGSQEAPLMRNVSESMAGRIALFQLLPLSLEEAPEKVSLFRGGFPEVIERPRSADTWFRSYIQTYLERDIRSLSSIRDLPTFRRFIALLASRSGQLLNKTDLAAPLGVSVPTITEWLSLLEITGQVLLIPPYFENFGKRLVKSSKVYWVDPGLACYLLGMESENQLLKSPFLGPLFEGFSAAEIIKHQINAGKQKQLYYFRDEQGLEIDFVVPLGPAQLGLVEVKAGRTLFPGMADSLLRLDRFIKKYQTRKWIIGMLRDSSEPHTRVIAPGVQAVSLRNFIRGLDSNRSSSRRNVLRLPQK